MLRGKNKAGSSLLSFPEDKVIFLWTIKMKLEWSRTSDSDCIYNKRI